MGKRSLTSRTTSKEPDLSRHHRHRAPGLAAVSSTFQQSRARIVLFLGMACAGLLIAAPLALFLSGEGSDSAGTSRNPDGVFTGDPNTGVGGGPGPSDTGVATESAQSPAPGLPPVDPAGSQVPAGGAAGSGG
ncbi:UNVERIFIED_ORG: hypothetical protein E4P37_13490, partial [Bacillus sp. AZ43]